MKMPENFLEKVLNNAQKAVTNSINEDNDITNMEIVCNTHRSNCSAAGSLELTIRR